MQIQLRFVEGKSFPQGLVTDVLEDLNRLLYRLERQDIENIRELFPSIPQVAVDAALFRLERYNHSAVYIEAARPGSLELVIAGSALAYWILEKTLAESFTEAWLKTDLHKRVRDFFLMGQKKKSEIIVSSMENNRLFNRRRIREKRIVINTKLSGDGRELLIEILDYEREDSPPSYRDIEKE